jgi:hypothetical protein
MVHLIAYELKDFRSRYDYARLHQAIREISGTYLHLPESRWLVETDLSTRAVGERLAPFTVQGDPLFVTRIYRDWYAYSLTQEQIDWLQGRNFASMFETVLSLLPIPKPAASMIRSAAFSPLLGGKR